MGPWLSSFIQLVLERYENLKQLDKNYNLETVILDINKDLLLPSNIRSYYRSLMTDTWNHFIFSEILKTSDLFKNIHKKEVNLKIQKILTVILDINIIQSLEIFIPNGFFI